VGAIADYTQALQVAPRDLPGAPADRAESRTGARPRGGRPL